MVTKKRSDGEGSVHQMHDRDCLRPTDKRGNPTCKCKWRGSITSPPPVPSPTTSTPSQRAIRAS